MEEEEKVEELTLCDVHGVAREARPLPHQRVLLGQQRRHLTAHQLVRDRPL